MTYQVTDRATFKYDNRTYVVLTVTFQRISGAMTVVELYRDDEGLEIFVGYLRADAEDRLLVKGRLARAALDLLLCREAAASR